MDIFWKVPRDGNCSAPKWVSLVSGETQAGGWEQLTFTTVTVTWTIRLDGWWLSRFKSDSGYSSRVFAPRRVGDRASKVRRISELLRQGGRERGRGVPALNHGAPLLSPRSPDSQSISAPQSEAGVPLSHVLNTFHIIIIVFIRGMVESSDGWSVLTLVPLFSIWASEPAPTSKSVCRLEL